MRTIYNISTYNSGTTGLTPIPSGSAIVVYDGANLQAPDELGNYATIPISSSGGSGADVAASYLVVSLTSSLTNERALAAGPGIAFNDGGANASFAISASLLAGPNVTINQVGNAYAISSSGGSGTGADPDASYIVVSNTSSLSAERALVAGPGIAFNDGGANGSFAISASLLAGPNVTINQVGNSFAISSSASGSGSGGSFVIEDTWWSHIDFYMANTGTITGGAGAGDYTVGTFFQVTKPRTITGLRFYTFFADLFTVALWGPDQNPIVSQSFNAVDSGSYSVTFSSSYDASPYQTLAVSQYSTSSQYNYAILPANYGQWHFVQAGPSYILEPNFGRYSTGNAYPATNTGPVYLVEPIFAPITQSVS